MIQICVGFLTLLLSATTAADTAAPNRLTVLDQERASLQSLVVMAEIETPKSNNRWSRFPMNFSYRAPNLYRSEIKTGGFEGDMIIVSDGKDIWTLLTKKKEVTRVPLEDEIASIKANGPENMLTVLATPTLRLAELFNVVDEKTDSGQIVLTLKAVKAVKSYDQIVLRTDAAGRTPLYAEAFKGGKTVARLYFNEYRRNAEVKDELFVFTVPAGVKVK